MVEVTELSKGFDRFFLGKIQFSLPSGFIMGLVGENGSGKTTLLRILSGLYTEHTGTVSLFGKTYGEEEQEIKDNIGTVFHESFFDEYETLLKNAQRYGAFYSRYDEALFQEMAVRFGLDTGKKAKKLSKGEYLKFSLAFALSHRPRLLLLDEPSANFDEDFRREFYGVLREFIADGEHSVILSTHQMEDVEQLADYLLMLKQGKQLLFGDIESIRDRYRMVSGEEYKIKRIRKDRVCYVEHTDFGCKALVKSNAWPFDQELKVREPTITELMYAFAKGDFWKKEDV